MKALFIVLGLLLVGATTYFLLGRAHEDHCGRAFGAADKVELSRLLDKPSEYLGKEVRVEGVVVRQCPNCGCWLFLKDSTGRELKVEMGDVGEPVPYRLGRKAMVEGRLIRYGEGFEFVGSALEFH